MKNVNNYIFAIVAAFFSTVIIIHCFINGIGKSAYDVFMNIFVGPTMLLFACSQIYLAVKKNKIGCN